ncbi:MAG: VacJ family lipoprotein [Burkholderiales bacterium]|nr:VacJ family lipoprotein [Opitutaceae bacterium]
MSRLALLTASLLAALAAAPAALAQGFSGPRAIDERTGAAPAADDYDEYAPIQVSDPIEGFNRGVFAFNDWTYTRVLTPAVKGYEVVVRPPVNRAISNFYDNVRYPIRVVNCLLQGKFSRAGLETKKFYVNTVAGLGGFIRQSDTVPDIAKVPREDFGQTLGVWGVPHGPYVVVPIFGGYSLRDLGGRVSDTVVSPTGWEYIDLGGHEWVADLDWEWQTAITVTDTMSALPGALDLYADMKNAAVDPYLSVRDATRRYRDAETAR